MAISRFVKDLSTAFQILNLKNDGLRKRFDSIKYDVKKIEEGGSWFLRAHRSGVWLVFEGIDSCWAVGAEERTRCDLDCGSENRVWKKLELLWLNIESGVYVEALVYMAIRELWDRIS